MTTTTATAELAAMLARWLHVGAAAVWLGVTARFLLLADRLAAVGPRGITLAHGGELFLLRRPDAPAPAPEGVLPVRWAPYLTCIFGFLLLALDWYADGGLRLVPEGGMLPAGWPAITVAIGAIVVGYLLYELLCPLLGRLPGPLQAVAWGAILVATGLAWMAVFEVRAALLHHGVLIATCMAANVGHHVAPFEKRLQRAGSGAAPDPLRRARARDRTRHNAYAMLPTLALMLAGHAPLALPPRAPVAFLAGLVLAGFALTDALAHFRHRPRRALAAALSAAAGTVILLLACLPREEPLASADPPDPAEVTEIVARRCLACHAGPSPAGGLALDRAGVLAQNARAVALAAAYGRSMPPGNVTGMTADERQLLRRWFEAGGAAPGER